MTGPGGKREAQRALAAMVTEVDHGTSGVYVLVLAEAVAKNWADLPAIAYREHFAQQLPLTPHALRHVAG